MKVQLCAIARTCIKTNLEQAARNDRQKPVAQDAETSSHIGSNVSVLGGKATSKEYLDALRQIMNLDVGSQAAGDTSALGNRQNHRDDSNPQQEGPDKTQRRRKRDSDDEFGPSAGFRANRPRHN
jgi:hypothetical protein